VEVCFQLYRGEKLTLVFKVGMSKKTKKQIKLKRLKKKLKKSNHEKKQIKLITIFLKTDRFGLISIL
jgi:tRNA(Phe) wybutosine-synthesizing methylase Tyw3